jgi:hypothetical protein
MVKNPELRKKINEKTLSFYNELYELAEEYNGSIRSLSSIYTSDTTVSIKLEIDMDRKFTEDEAEHFETKKRINLVTKNV